MTDAIVTVVAWVVPAPLVERMLASDRQGGVVVLPSREGKEQTYAYDDHIIDELKLMRRNGVEIDYLEASAEDRQFLSEYSSVATELAENVVYGFIGNFGYDIVKSLFLFQWERAKAQSRDLVLKVAELTRSDGATVRGLELRCGTAADVNVALAALKDLLDGSSSNEG